MQDSAVQNSVLGGVELGKLPSGWVQVQPNFSYRGSLKQFGPPAGKQTAITIHHYRMKKSTGRNLKKIFAAPPHSLDSAELEELADLVPECSNDAVFILSYAKTIDLAGRRVLVIEGKNKQTSKDSYFVYTASADTGFEDYTSVSFEAPHEDYVRYRDQAIEAIHSLTFI